MEAYEKRPVKITEHTLVPLGLLIMILGSVIASVAWLTTINAQTTENTKVISDMVRKQDTYNDNIQKISNDLSEIKGQLKRRYE